MTSMMTRTMTITQLRRVLRDTAAQRFSRIQVVAANTSRARPGIVMGFHQGKTMVCKNCSGSVVGFSFVRSRQRGDLLARLAWFHMAITLPCLVLIGCAPAVERKPLFTPMAEAVRIVDDNQASLPSGLRAIGSAGGHFLDGDGVKRHFDLDFKMQVRPGEAMRVVLAHPLAGDELRLGLNERKWWIWSRRPKEQQLEGDRADGGLIVAGNIPVRAEQLMQALGLEAIHSSDAVQRVTADVQQLIFVARDPATPTPAIVKEYWLDRYEPRLIRKVVFCDDEGRVTFESFLDRYGPVQDGKGMLPRDVHIQWPDQGAEMKLRIRRWSADPKLTADHAAFVSPSDRAGMFD